MFLQNTSVTFIFGVCQWFYLMNSFSFYKSLLIDTSPGYLNYFLLCPDRCPFFNWYFSFSSSNQNSLLFVILLALMSSLMLCCVYIFMLAYLFTYLFTYLFIYSFIFVVVHLLFKSSFVGFVLAKVSRSLGWFGIC